MGFTYAMVWNEEIQRIELYATNHAAYTFGTGQVSIYLFNPATNPVGVEVIGNTDQNSLQVWTSMPVQVPGTLGSVPPKTLLMGANGLEGPPVQLPDKLRTFIAANKRKWVDITGQPRAYMPFTYNQPYNTDQVSTYSSTETKFPMPCFGNWVPVTDSSGVCNGEVVYTAGGDADYGGNEVTTIRLDQVSGTTCPGMSNTATSTAAFSNWFQRTHAHYAHTSTAQPYVIADKDNLGDWAPISIHSQFVNTYIPGYGYVMDWMAPGGITVGLAGGGALSPATRMPSTYSWENDPQQSDLTLWGSRSRFNDYASSRGSVRALICWSRTGSAAGKWRKIIEHTPTGLVDFPSGRATRLCDFNPIANKLIAFQEVAGGGGRIWSWRPGVDTQFQLEDYLTNVSEVINGDGLEVFAEPGSNIMCGHWLTGNLYLAQRHSNGAGLWPTNGFLIWDDSAKTLTRAKGAYGSPIIDAAATAGKHIAFCVDRANARALWLIGTLPCYPDPMSPAQLYQSPLTDVWNLRPMYVSGADSLNLFYGGNDASVGLKPMFAANGYLHLSTAIGTPGQLGNQASLRILRMPIY